MYFDNSRVSLITINKNLWLKRSPSELQSNLPYNSEGAVAYGAVGLHICGDGRRLVVGRRRRQDGALRRALRSALHQRHRHTHRDARVPRGAGYSRHPTAPRRAVTADSAPSHAWPHDLGTAPYHQTSPPSERTTISPATSLLFMLDRLCGNHWTHTTRNGIQLSDSPVISRRAVSF